MLQVVAALEAALKTDEKKLFTGGDDSVPPGVFVSSAVGASAGPEAADLAGPRLPMLPKANDFGLCLPGDDFDEGDFAADLSVSLRVGVGGVTSVSGAAVFPFGVDAASPADEASGKGLAVSVLSGKPKGISLALCGRLVLGMS